MMKKKGLGKKLLSAIAGIALVVGLMPLSAFATTAGSLWITLNVTVDGASTTSTLADGTYTFHVSNADGQQVEDLTVTIENGESKTVSEGNLPHGTYTVTEDTSNFPAGMTAEPVSQTVSIEGVDLYNPLVFTNNLSTTVTYTVRFVNDDGTVLQSGQVAAGETPKYEGEEPTKPSTAQYEYVFSGWQPAIVAVAGDATYTATYEEVARLYTVIWLNYDGTEIYRDRDVPFGQVPAYEGPEPTRPATAEYTYTFKGWEPKIVALTGDATYTAVFEAKPAPQKATLTFDLGGGTLNGQTGSITIEANVGDVIAIPDAPVRDGYTFKCWKGSEYHPGDKYTVEGDHAFTAVWEKAAKGTSAKTGDELGGTIAALGTMAVFALCLAFFALCRRRRPDEEKRL